MKFKAFKRCRKYTDIYTKEKETKELQIELDGVRISVTEHQYGVPINDPWIDITVKGKNITYSMGLSTFIKKIST